MIASCKVGDRDAFANLVERYQRFVYTTAQLKVGCDSDALDVSQEVFIKIWRNIEKYRGDCRFSTWVYKITVNASLDFLRHSKVSAFDITPLRSEDGDEVTVEIADERAESPEIYAERQETVQAVREAIDMLSPEQREVINLRDIEGFSYDEISEMLGIEKGTVKSRLNRARGNLREILLKKGVCGFD